MKLQQQSTLHCNPTEQLCNKSAHTGAHNVQFVLRQRVLIGHRGDFLPLCPERCLICSSYRRAFVKNKGLTSQVRHVQSHLFSSGCHAAREKRKTRLAKGKPGGMHLRFYFSQEAMWREPCDQREDLINRRICCIVFLRRELSP